MINLINICQKFLSLNQNFLKCFRDLIRVPRIENRVPRIRWIGSLQIHTGYLTFSFKKPALNYSVTLVLLILSQIVFGIAGIFQRVFMNLNMTVGQATCRLLCRHSKHVGCFVCLVVVVWASFCSCARDFYSRGARFLRPPHICVVCLFFRKLYILDTTCDYR